MSSLAQSLLQEVERKDVLIGRPYTLPRINDEPSFYVSFGQINTGDKFNEMAYGISLNKGEAQLIMLAEALERFHLLYPRANEQVIAKHKNLQGQTLDLTSFCYHRPHKSIEKTLADREISWTGMKKLGSRKTYFVPTQAIFWHEGYRLKKSESSLAIYATNGSAFGTDHDQTIYRAVCEAIERDTIVKHFIEQKPPEQLKMKKVPGYLRSMVEKLHRYKLKETILMFDNQYGTNVIAALIEDETGHIPNYTIGFGCDTNINLAIKKAIMEAVLSRVSLRYFVLNDNPDHDGDVALRMRKHIKRWYSDGLPIELQFLMNGGAVDMSRSRKKPADVIGKLHERVFYKVIRNKSPLYYVAKVIIPGMFYLYYEKSEFPRYHPDLEDHRFKYREHPFL